MTETSFWNRLLEWLQEQGANLRTLLEPRPPTETVAFSISFIALAAKLSKADGRVTVDEVTGFRTIFDIPASEEENAARVFNLCRQETTGFESYARKIAKVVRNDDEASGILTNVLDGLFYVAIADGSYHEEEDFFLGQVAEIFGLDRHVFEGLKAQHVPGQYDPFAILEVAPGATADEIKRAQRRLVRENHPDLLRAQGMPPDLVRLAEDRLVAINRAYEILEARPENVSA